VSVSLVPVLGFVQFAIRTGYWSGLLSSVDFTQKKLQQCLDVIHRDIVAVWNIRDPNDVHFFH
jgi:hypothetical protein